MANRIDPMISTMNNNSPFPTVDSLNNKKLNNKIPMISEIELS